MNTSKICLLVLLSTMLSGAVLSAQERIPVRRAVPLEANGLPDAVDNSLSKYFPPLIDQIGGSCAQASYIGYMYTYEMSRMLDRNPADSPAYRYSYLYTWNFINDGTDTGSYGVDGLRIAASNGLMTEADYPKTSSVYSFYWASGYERYFRAMFNRISRFVLMPLTTREELDQVRRYLYDHGQTGSGSGGIVTFSSRSSDWKMNNNYQGPSRTGYKSMLTALATEGGHAMTIVGYDDLVEFNAPDGTLSKGAFIVCNTWGSWSHDNGRYYLPYWFFLNRKGVDEGMLSSDVCALEAEYREPELAFRVMVDCDKRNNLCFSMGVSSLTADYPTVEYMEHIANYQGGPHKMAGQYASSTVEFGFDFSSAVKFMDNLGAPSFYLTINRNSKDGYTAEHATLKGFSVYDYRAGLDKPVIYEYKMPSGGLKINSGKNVFRLDTAEPPTVSRSAVKWIGRDGTPVTSPLVFRTASGGHAKLRVMQYDRKAGKMKIKYVYSPSGDRNLE